MSTHSEATKTFKCTADEACSFSARRNADLKTHVARIHSDEKPFQCNLCEHRCAVKKDLTSHIK